MSAKPIIAVEKLSKRYRLGEIGATTLRDSVARFIRARWRRPQADVSLTECQQDGRNSEAVSDVSVKPQADSGLRRGDSSMTPDTETSAVGYMWALRDVSLDIQQGDVVGIIGRNGAGKTTLLKILSRITEPTSGRATIRGRVGSLLEIGTGFHYELTGRENIYLSGSIMGLAKREIDERISRIIDFSEIERFIDTPVKRYSDGMYVRLAFSVAAHLEPEILLVDEILSVGDLAFQKKCLGSMRSLADRNRTVLFVSHNMDVITRLCSKCVLLSAGRVVAFGESADVVREYQGKFLAISAEWVRAPGSSPGTDFAFLRIALEDERGRPRAVFGGDEAWCVVVDYEIASDMAGCHVGFKVCRSDGFVILTTTDADAHETSALPRKPGRYRSRVSIPGRFLAPGMYSLQFFAAYPYRCVYETIEQAVVLEIAPQNSIAALHGPIAGLIAPLFQWATDPAGNTAGNSSHALEKN